VSGAREEPRLGLTGARVAAARVAATLALAAPACAADVFLAVPTDAAAWIAAERASASEPYRFRLLVPTPGEPLLERATDAATTLVLLGLPTVPSIALGDTSTIALVPRDPLDASLVPLPAPTHVLELDPGAQLFERLLEAPPELSALAYADPSSDRCPTFEELDRDASLLATVQNDEEALFGWPVSPTETVVGTELGLFLVTARTARNIYPRALSSGGRAEDGRTFVVDARGVDEVVITSTRGVRVRRVADFSTLTPQLPPGWVYAPRWLVPHANGDMHALDKLGILAYLHDGRWSVLDTPPPPLDGSARRFLARVTEGDDEIASGTFSDAQYLRGRGAQLRVVRPPDTTYGGTTGLIRHPSGELVMTTSRGLMLDERTGFQPFEGAEAYGGILYHALRTFRGGVVFGGDTGTFGYLTPGRRLCRPETPVQSGVRVILPLGDGLILGGRPKEISPEQLTIHRIGVR
jgi:hypothetical protein